MALKHDKAGFLVGEIIKTQDDILTAQQDSVRVLGRIRADVPAIARAINVQTKMQARSTASGPGGQRVPRVAAVVGGRSAGPARTVGGNRTAEPTSRAASSLSRRASAAVAVTASRAAQRRFMAGQSQASAGGGAGGASRAAIGGGARADSRAGKERSAREAEFKRCAWREGSSLAKRQDLAGRWRSVDRTPCHRRIGQHLPREPARIGSMNRTTEPLPDSLIRLEIAKLMAQTVKLGAETAKMQHERAWQPVVLMTVALAVGARLGTFFGA